MFCWWLAVESVEVGVPGCLWGIHQSPHGKMLQWLACRYWGMLGKLLRGHGREGVRCRIWGPGTSSGGPGAAAVIQSAHQYFSPFIHWLLRGTSAGEVRGGEYGPWVVARAGPQTHHVMGRSVKEPTGAGASVRILGEAFRGVHGWRVMALISQVGFFTAVEQRWGILRGGVFCGTLQKAHAVFPLL